jgi:hypothetical protein
MPVRQSHVGLVSSCEHAAATSTGGLNTAPAEAEASEASILALFAGGAAASGRAACGAASAGWQAGWQESVSAERERQVHANAHLRVAHPEALLSSLNAHTHAVEKLRSGCALLSFLFSLALLRRPTTQHAVRGRVVSSASSRSASVAARVDAHTTRLAALA